MAIQLITIIFPIGTSDQEMFESQSQKRGLRWQMKQLIFA